LKNCFPKNNGSLIQWIEAEKGDLQVMGSGKKSRKK
jgi:hypothetical protein